MATQAKIDHVAELVEKIKKAQSVVLVDYQGISVNDETALRRKMREAGAEYLVTKNRLFKIALKEAGVEDSFEDILEGTTAFAFGYNDPVAPAKIVFDLAKDKAKAKQNIFKIKGGVLTGKRVTDHGSSGTVMGNSIAGLAVGTDKRQRSFRTHKRKHHLSRSCPTTV